ncbi:uncharacterized protein LOC129409755 isoform X2 [Boleophthalmus pectinirostris]|uniref:uncharacterized protein LOC129409755 isoform X2 n=1 Tax=Boleophthalmus pectinirostris TaxID=150288 RepID=UPI002430F9AB|nr:uncharacterized protein LOC129409755 isoform X2 [Boleophthalmus pectinirostris]
MSSCCVLGCENWRNNTCDSKLKFYRIPADTPSQKTRRQLWLNAIRRSNWTETIVNNAHVCSAHFISGEASLDAESPDFVPSVFPHKQQNSIPSEKMERPARKKKKEHRKMLQKSTNKEITKEDILELRLIAPDAVVLTSIEKSDTDTASECDKVEDPPEPPEPPTAAHDPALEQQRTAADLKESCGPSMANETLKKKEDKVLVPKSSFKDIITGKNINYQDLKMQHSVLYQAYTKLLAEAQQLRTDNEKLRNSLQSDFSKLSYRFLKWDAKQIRFLTGLPSVAFDWLLSRIEYNVIRVHPEFKAEDHLLIVLMKLKMGLCDDDLGYRFRMSGEIITAICQTWIPTLAVLLSPLIEWQSDDVIHKSKPDIFKTKFRKCCCFLDCVEFAVATPKGATKHVKYFVSTTPAGAISFLAPGFNRSVSEQQALKMSGFFELFKTPSQILASRTFAIKEELAKIRVTLHTPARGFTADSAVWSHVNVVLGWWKDFGIFQTAVPASYEEMMNDVVMACAALTNLKMSLVPNVVKNQKRKRKRKDAV